MRMTIAFAVLALLLAYVSRHLWLVFPLPVWGRWLVVALVVGGFSLGILAIMPVLDRVPMPVASAIYNLGNRTLIAILYLLLAFLVADVLRLVHVLPAPWLRDNWATALVVCGAVAALLIGGRIHYEHKQRVVVEVDSQGKLEQPMKVLAISDLHLGYHNRRADLKRWVDLINSERPDAVLIAGDLIDRSLRPLLADSMATELRRIQAPVYACLGNHEYYAGYFDHPADVERFYSDAGIALLRDGMATLGPLAIVGRDDRTNPRRASVADLYAKHNVQPSQFTILLDHQPYHLEEAEQCGTDLQISGHTHRGQVWPMSWVIDALYECAWGTVRKEGTTVCVTSGLGIWGAKYRIGTQSEYLIINIK